MEDTVFEVLNPRTLPGFVTVQRVLIFEWVIVCTNFRVCALLFHSWKNFSFRSAALQAEPYTFTWVGNFFMAQVGLMSH